MSNLNPLMSSARTGDINKDEWRTPKWLFDALDNEFRFILDPAATENNTLCEWYFDKEEDGLRSPWFGNVFVNPPYSQLKKWVEKGYEEARNNKKVERVVMLVPARSDTQAWWRYIRLGEVRFLPGRLKFNLPDEYVEQQEMEALERAAAGKSSEIFRTASAPFPSAIVIFDRARLSRPKTVYWDIRESTHASTV